MNALSRNGLAALAFVLSACGNDNNGPPPGSQAQQFGVGAACTSGCGDAGLQCLPFKGGYCGLKDCTGDADCPAGSACVTHDDGKNYCFLVCIDKPECNLYRPVESTSNCSSSVTFVGGAKDKKACVPPS